MAAPPTPQVAAEGALLPSLRPGASIRAGQRWWWGWGAQGAELEALNLPENIRDAVTLDWAKKGEV